MKQIILVKYGEISLKGKNRYFFESKLIENIALALDIRPRDIKKHYGRIYIDWIEGQSFSVYEKALKRVFGIVGFVRAVQLPLTHDLETLKPCIIELLKQETVSQKYRFQMDTRRVTKEFPLESMEVNRQLGEWVLMHFSHWQVDLEDPEINIRIEIREEGFFVYLEHQAGKGPGGLPVGVSGKGLLLLSGGIDSPVAGWSLLKRGMTIDAVHFHSFPYTGEKAKEKAIDLVKVLSQWKLHAIQLYLPYFTKIQELVNQVCPQETWTILHRRFMFRIAEKITQRAVAYDAIITGDNLGQVASQTIQNIAVISEATTLPVLRPLIAFDKQDIITLAKRIETYRISSRPYEDCCTLFAPKNPLTKATLTQILLAEKNLDIESLVNEAVTKMDILKISHDKFHVRSD